MELTCYSCKESFTVTPRPGNWTGRLRYQIRCPHCQYEYREAACPRGIVSTRPSVELLTLDEGRFVALEDYEVTTDEAQAFAQTFQAAWERIPSSAREVITRHWLAVHDAPHVWLLQNCKDWAGNGWAGSFPDGRSLFFLSTIAPHVPAEHLQLFMSHECGHVLCIASNEPAHVVPTSDPMRRYRQEWLVWQLMQTWGFDQLAAETWMEQNVEEAGGPRLRDAPLAWETSQEKIAGQHRDIEGRLTDKSIPAQLSAWLSR